MKNRSVEPTPTQFGEREHLREHLTDGRWHDDCGLCLRRRRHGGTGIRCQETITPNDLTYQCERSEGHDGEHRDWRISWQTGVTAEVPNV